MSVFEDHYDENGKPIEKGKKKIEELARQAMSVPESLNCELPWLLTSAAENAYSFGYNLAQFDTNFSVFPSILTNYGAESTNTALLTGYLRWIFETNQDLWEEQLDSLTAHERLNPETRNNGGIWCFGQSSFADSWIGAKRFCTGQ